MLVLLHLRGKSLLSCCVRRLHGNASSHRPFHVLGLPSIRNYSSPSSFQPHKRVRPVKSLRQFNAGAGLSRADSQVSPRICTELSRSSLTALHCTALHCTDRETDLMRLDLTHIATRAREKLATSVKGIPAAATAIFSCRNPLLLRLLLRRLPAILSSDAAAPPVKQ